VIDPFLGLVLLRFDKVTTVFTTSFDCVGSHPSVAVGTRTGARVGLDVFVERSLVNLFESHDVHEGRCVTLTAPQPTRGAQKPLSQETVTVFLYSGLFVKLTISTSEGAITKDTDSAVRV